MLGSSRLSWLEVTHEWTKVELSNESRGGNEAYLYWILHIWLGSFTTLLCAQVRKGVILLPDLSLFHSFLISTVTHSSLRHHKFKASFCQSQRSTHAKIILLVRASQYSLEQSRGGQICSVPQYTGKRASQPYFRSTSTIYMQLRAWPGGLQENIPTAL
jgi:hypothetical protein